MRGKDLKELAEGEHKVRLKGMRFTLTKTKASFPNYGYLYKIENNIIIHICPVYDKLMITTHQHGITFSRDLQEQELTIY